MPNSFWIILFAWMTMSCQEEHLTNGRSKHHKYLESPTIWKVTAPIQAQAPAARAQAVPAALVVLVALQAQATATAPTAQEAILALTTENRCQKHARRRHFLKNCIRKNHLSV